jgi:hypothetical protein
MLLLLPVFVTLMVFTLVASTIMRNYNEQHQLIIIQGAENQLTSTIQQLYQMVSLDEIQPCTITKTNPLPSTIDSEPYTVTGSITDGALTLTFYFPGTNVRHDVTVTLGPRARAWVGGELNSLSTNPVIEVTKSPDDNTLVFKFG